MTDEATIETPEIAVVTSTRVRKRKTELERRLEASLLYVALAKLPSHRLGRDLLAGSVGLEAGDVLDAIIWMRSRGVAIRVLWQPNDASDVLLDIAEGACRVEPRSECPGPHDPLKTR